MTTDIMAMPSITIICLLLAQAFKATPLDKKYIPVICGFLGAILGILGVYVAPGFPATDVLTGAATGIVSGLAATGTHQIYKQLGAGK